MFLLLLDLFSFFSSLVLYGRDIFYGFLPFDLLLFFGFVHSSYFFGFVLSFSELKLLFLSHWHAKWQRFKKSPFHEFFGF